MRGSRPQDSADADLRRLRQPCAPRKRPPPGTAPGAAGRTQTMTPVARCLAALGLALLPSACMLLPPEVAEPPAMRWDHRPEATLWTTVALDEAEDHDAALAKLVPQDIDSWCPGYRQGSLEDRRAFWVGILSALAKHESTWNPRASGGGGLWIGLTQIDPRTARWFGCEADTSAELKDGAANLACAIQIAAVQVPRDGMVAGNGRQGLGRDWAPFRSAARRADMASWTRAQAYCQPPARLASVTVATMSAAVPPARD
jgi:hypothetical protein